MGHFPPNRTFLIFPKSRDFFRHFQISWTGPPLPNPTSTFTPATNADKNSQKIKIYALLIAYMPIYDRYGSFSTESCFFDFSEKSWFFLKFSDFPNSLFPRICQPLKYLKFDQSFALAKFQWNVGAPCFAPTIDAEFQEESKFEIKNRGHRTQFFCFSMSARRHHFFQKSRNFRKINHILRVPRPNFN